MREIKEAVFILLMAIVNIASGASASGQGAPPVAGKQLLPVTVNGFTGMIDEKGKVVLKPEYKIVMDYSEGLAEVAAGAECSMDEGIFGCKCGYADATGTIVIEPKYDDARAFHDGMAAVAFGANCRPRYPENLDCKWGFIDRTGKVIVEPKYALAGNFTDGLAPVGEECHTVETESYKGNECKWGYIDKTGATVIENKYDDYSQFDGGTAYVAVGGKWGVINASGTAIIEPRYDEVTTISDHAGNPAAYKIRIGTKWGLAGPTKKEVFAPMYDDIEVFDHGSLGVKLGGKWGFADRSGKKIIEPAYDAVSAFSEGIAAVGAGSDCDVYSFRYSCKWGYIREDWGKLTTMEFDKAGDFGAGVALVKFEGFWGLINAKCLFIMKPQFTAAWDSFSEGLAAVGFGRNCVLMNDTYDCKWGFIDTAGKIAIPLRFYSVMPFQNGLAAAALQVDCDPTGMEYCPPKFGLIDKTGKMVVEPQFDDISSADGELFEVRNGFKKGYIDAQGTFIWEPTE